MNTETQIRVPVYDSNGKLKTIRMIEKPAAPSMQFDSLQAQLAFDGEPVDIQADQRTLPRCYQGPQGPQGPQGS